MNIELLKTMAAALKADSPERKALEDAIRTSEQAASEANAPVRTKIAEQGGLSVFGLGSFPTTLYKAQWEKLLSEASLAVIRKALTDPALAQGKDDPRFEKARAAAKAKKAEAKAAAA